MTPLTRGNLSPYRPGSTGVSPPVCLLGTYTSFCLLVFSSLDCLYTNTSHLEVNFSVEVIKPGKSLEIPIIFYPREAINYREVISFEINGLSQQTVEIKGKGTEMKVRDGGQGFRTSPFLFPDPCPREPTGLSTPSSPLHLGLLHPISSPARMGSLIIRSEKAILNCDQANLRSYFTVLMNSDNCKHKETFHVLGEVSDAMSHLGACLIQT